MGLSNATFLVIKETKDSHEQAKTFSSFDYLEGIHESIFSRPSWHTREPFRKIFSGCGSARWMITTQPHAVCRFSGRCHWKNLVSNVNWVRVLQVNADDIFNFGVVWSSQNLFNRHFCLHLESIRASYLFRINLTYAWDILKDFIRL